jgi:hypothetical protein
MPAACIKSPGKGRAHTKKLCDVEHWSFGIETNRFLWQDTLAAIR